MTRNAADHESPLPHPASPGERVDDAVRAHHADAVANVSARTQAQLHQRMRAALAPAIRSHRPAWALTAACSLALVAALALQLRAPDVPAPTPVVALDATADNGELLASLDEAPDFYLWLASDDASMVVPE